LLSSRLLARELSSLLTGGSLILALGVLMGTLGLVGRNEAAHSEAVWACAFGQRGGEEVLATGGLDETVKVFGRGSEGPTRKHTYSNHPLGVASLTASGSRAAATALDSYVRVWDLTSDATTALLEFHAAEAWGVAFLPESASQSMLAVARGARGTASLFDYNSDSNTTLELPQPRSTGASSNREAFVLDVAVSDDGSRVAATQMGGGVSLFDTESGKLLHSFKTLNLPVRSVTISGETVLAASDNGEVHALDARTGSMIEVYPAHSGWAMAVSPHPDGKMFISGGSDGCVRLWELGSRQPVQSQHDFDDSVWGVAFNSSGSLLGACSEDASVSMYDYV